MRRLNRALYQIETYPVSSKMVRINDPVQTTAQKRNLLGHDTWQHSWLKEYPSPLECDIVYYCALQDHTLCSVWPFKRDYIEQNFRGFLIINQKVNKTLFKIFYTPQDPEEVNEQKPHSLACIKQFKTAQFPCFNVCSETAAPTWGNPTEKKSDVLLTWIVKRDIVGFYFLSFQDLCFSCVITDNFLLHAYALLRKRMFAVISENHE